MAKFELITPDIAADILKRNTSNRKISARYVKKYAEEMTSGNWQKNYEPIVISKTGRLLNGQHRLLAILESGQSVEIYVVRDADDNVTIFDRGRNRTEFNELQLSGVDIANKKTIAIAKLFLSMLGVNSGVETSAKYVMFFATFKKHLQKLNNITTGSNGKKGSVNPRSAYFELGYILAIDNGVDIETIQAFIEVFKTGYSPRGELDSAAITARNQFTEGNLRDLRGRTYGGGFNYRTNATCILMIAIEDFNKGVIRKKKYNLEKIKRTPFIKYPKYKEMVQSWVNITIEEAMHRYFEEK